MQESLLNATGQTLCLLGGAKQMGTNSAWKLRDAEEVCGAMVSGLLHARQCKRGGARIMGCSSGAGDNGVWPVRHKTVCEGRGACRWHLGCAGGRSQLFLSRQCAGRGQHSCVSRCCDAPSPALQNTVLPHVAMRCNCAPKCESLCPLWQTGASSRACGVVALPTVPSLALLVPVCLPACLPACLRGALCVSVLVWCGGVCGVVCWGVCGVWCVGCGVWGVVCGVVRCGICVWSCCSACGKPSLAHSAPTNSLACL